MATALRAPSRKESLFLKDTSPSSWTDSLWRNWWQRIVNMRRSAPSSGCSLSAQEELCAAKDSNQATADDSPDVTLHKPPHKRSRSGTIHLVRASEDEQREEELKPSHLFWRSASQEEPVRLWLPRQGSSLKVDEHLARIPRVVSRAEQLLQEEQDEEEASAASTPREGNLPALLHDTPHRCLNVLQGEVAHVSADQADIVVSAEATTCHVIALRSTCNTGDSPPFCSLAHMDRAYSDCVEGMIQEHLAHHGEFHRKRSDNSQEGFFMEDDELAVSPPSSHHRKPSFLPDLRLEEEESVTKEETVPSVIEMELHIVGGYLDSNGLSQKLSNQIIARFDELALKYEDRVRMYLSTAAISSLNNCNQNNKPKSRGLGIVTKTGQVFSLKSSLPARLQGPALSIRSARSFATCQSEPTLAVIHDRTCQQGEIRIRPFGYRQRQDLNVLLQVPDEVLLSVASTSPEHESDEFCTKFRRTLSFVNTVPPESVFGEAHDRPLVYVRSAGDLNAWEPHNDDDMALASSRGDLTGFWMDGP